MKSPRSGARRLRIVMVAVLLSVAEGGRAWDGGPPVLAPAFGSPEAVTRAALQALAARDVEGLGRLALDETEFRRLVWPRLPSSRPERNLDVAYAWGDLHQKSTGYLRSVVAARGGDRLELVDVRFDGETTDFGTFRVHRRARVRVRAPRGQLLDGRFFGSIIEAGGRFKIFSFVVD